MQKAYVYYLTFQSSGLFYIGSTFNVEKRINRHLNELCNKTHHNQILQNAWTGTEEIFVNAFEFESREKAYEYEEECLKRAFNGPSKHKLANISLNSRYGDVLTLNPKRDLIISNIKQTLKNNISSLTPEQRKTRYAHFGNLNGMYGKNHTDETKKLISEKNKNKRPWLGKKHSQVTKQKLSQIGKQLIGSKNPFFGKTHSDETKLKLRQRFLGKETGKAKKVFIDGIIYKSSRDAAEKLNISSSLVSYKAIRDRFPNWYYIEETNTA